MGVKGLLSLAANWANHYYTPMSVFNSQKGSDMMSTTSSCLRHPHLNDEVIFSSGARGSEQSYL